MDKLLTRCHVSWNLELIRKNRLLEVRVREVLIFWALNHHGIDCLVAIFKILFKKKLARYIVLIFTKVIEGESNRKRNSWAVNSDDYIIVYQSLNSALGCRLFAFLDIVAIADYSYFARNLQSHGSEVELKAQALWPEMSFETEALRFCLHDT